MTTFEEARAIAAANRGVEIATYGLDAGDRWLLATAEPLCDDTRMSVIKATGEYIEDYGIPGEDYDFISDAVEVGVRPT